MLLHWQHTGTWPSRHHRWQDGIQEAEVEEGDRGRGASVHGLPALRQVPGNKWLDVAMIRMNHKGKSMDAEDYATNGPGNVPEVVEHVKQVRKEGMGVISMKLIGEGHVQPRGSAEGDEVRVPECGRRLRDRRLQEHSRDRRGD